MLGVCDKGGVCVLFLFGKRGGRKKLMSVKMRWLGMFCALLPCRLDYIYIYVYVAALL